MRPEELLIGGRMRLDELEQYPGSRLRLEPLPDRRILGSRKAMPLWQGERIAVGGIGPHQGIPKGGSEFHWVSPRPNMRFGPRVSRSRRGS